MTWTDRKNSAEIIRFVRSKLKNKRLTRTVGALLFLLHLVPVTISNLILWQKLIWCHWCLWLNFIMFGLVCVDRCIAICFSSSFFFSVVRHGLCIFISIHGSIWSYYIYIWLVIRLIGTGFMKIGACKMLLIKFGCMRKRESSTTRKWSVGCWCRLFYSKKKSRVS